MLNKAKSSSEYSSLFIFSCNTFTVPIGSKDNFEYFFSISFAFNVSVFNVFISSCKLVIVFSYCSFRDNNSLLLFSSFLLFSSNILFLFIFSSNVFVVDIILLLIF